MILFVKKEIRVKGWNIKMKTVILYETKTGTTERCAKLLAEK